MRHRGTTSSNPAHARSSLAVASVALVALAGLLVVTGDTALAVSQATPRNTAEPVVSGSTRVGATLATNRGSWANAPTSYSYQWVRCEPDGGRPDGANCAAIGGATTTRYVLAPADVGRRLRARVTARNDDGAATVASNPTDAIVSASVPVNTRRPTISGRAEVNQQLRVEPGTWSGRQPITYSYQWLRCDNRGDNCVTQPGFVDDNYVLRDGDIGRRARVRVTAINSDGTSSRLTAPSAVVAALSGPPGAIKLSNGETSIPVTSVPSTERLIVDVVGFEPNVVRSLARRSRSASRSRTHAATWCETRTSSSAPRRS